MNRKEQCLALSSKPCIRLAWIVNWNTSLPAGMTHHLHLAPALRLQLWLKVRLCLYLFPQSFLSLPHSSLCPLSSELQSWPVLPHVETGEACWTFPLSASLCLLSGSVRVREHLTLALCYSFSNDNSHIFTDRFNALWSRYWLTPTVLYPYVIYSTSFHTLVSLYSSS